MAAVRDFAARLLAWFDRHGRHDLPWQRERSCYRVWLAEVMLQQTQVQSVIPYYQRFLARFPDIQSLAAAPLDDVLALWSGLGYYARARNLHRAAQQVCTDHGGRFPEAIEPLMALPGVGRSTAGAILAQALGQRHPILDGNVRRLLARYHAVDGPASAAPVRRRLWELAERHTPDRRLADYTQAVMDLGATLCTPRRPRCEECPVAAGCAARRLGRQMEFPQRAAPRVLPTREAVMLLLHDGQGRLLLERRPPSGVWGGLWSLPQMASVAEADEWYRQWFGRRLAPQGRHALRHTFSHYRLEATILAARAPSSTGVGEGGGRWFGEAEIAGLGLPAPLKRFLQELERPVARKRHGVVSG